MLDDLRNSSSFLEDEPPPEPVPVRPRIEPRPKKEKFLGLTAQQRFILSLLLFLIVCVIGTFGLLISGSISLPF
jgi:hypothetical protein